MESIHSASSPGYDGIVRTNIQIIRGNLQSIEANLRNLNRNFISRRIVESLHDKLKQTFEVILQTETAFKSWLQEQQQNGGSGKEAMDKQRDKFLFEKLFAHFQAEIRRVQDLSDQVRAAAERAADPTSSQGVESTGVILDMENAGAYADADSDSLFISEDPREIAEFDFVSENDALLSRAVAEERFQGIRRIHAQVSQANHIFKDLANLIFSQGETLNSIETQMQDAHAHSKAATLELRQASRMQQRSRQRCVKPQCVMWLQLCWQRLYRHVVCLFVHMCV
ncbi:syntaxin-21 [Cyclospora cayetanensis]|uniref:Syntaxin-21 n=1 Tax=Cyclospora cayetanensis TaxID=88456 RepID=A0A6P6RT70_9EIME|nr:syntaxin-21 [Cyclospora cayetanensis]